MADGSGNVTLEWGDGEHAFRLPLKQLRELQDKTDCGPEALYERIRSGKWMVADLRETIRLGLIGGGMDEVAASKLVRQYFDGGPLLKHKPTAAAIVLAALLGPPDDPVGKAGRGSQDQQDGTGASPSPDSSEAPAPSA
jgi:hypothetical protein